MTFHTIAARCNCPSDWGRDTRCPKCHQFHLRPGYCQALNPEASAAIAAGGVETLDEARRLAALPEELTLPPPGPFSFETDEDRANRTAHAKAILAGAEKRVGKKPVHTTVHAGPVNTPTVHAPVHKGEAVNKDEARKAYRREWMKRKREAKARQAD